MNVYSRIQKVYWKNVISRKFRCKIRTIKISKYKADIADFVKKTDFDEKLLKD